MKKNKKISFSENKYQFLILLFPVTLIKYLTIPFFQVQLHSPAGRAGLQPRDLLVSVAGQIVFDMKHDEVAGLVSQ
jgi:PDZ domain